MASPLSNGYEITQWQRELLISNLLLRDMAELALRALRASGPRIKPRLEIRTLLSNSLVTEAFELQRTKRDETLLQEFFKCCYEQKRWAAVLKLTLTEKEGEALCKFLRTCDSPLSNNFELIYLLQRNKYTEALKYLQNEKSSERPRAQTKSRNRPQNLVFAAYQLALAPWEQQLSTEYMALKDNVEAVTNANEDNTESLGPLSQDINNTYLSSKQNVFGGIFHRALIGSKQTTNHLLHPTMKDNVGKCYVPFLSKPQIDFDYVENNNYKPISSPTAYVPVSKRRIDDSFERDDDPLPAAKRKRTDEFVMSSVLQTKHSQEINKSLLTSFRQRAVSTPIRSSILPTQEETEYDVTPEKNQDNDGAIFVNLLSTPVVTSSRLANKHSPNLSERGRATPQSILKRRTDGGSCSQSRRSISPSLSARSARRSVDFDERSLRYHQRQLNLDISEEGAPLNTIPESIDDSASDSNSSSFLRMHIKARPPIRLSGENSPASTSADEFFSPNTSKSELEEALLAAARRTRAQQQHYPGKSPSRSSTPEVDLPQRITRSKSRQILNESDEMEDNSTVTSTPMVDDLLPVSSRAKSSTPLAPKPKPVVDVHKSPRKSLSRIAVETSARRLIERRMTDEKSDDAPDFGTQRDDSIASSSDGSMYKMNSRILADYSSDNMEELLKRFPKKQQIDITVTDSSFDEPSRVGSKHFLEDFDTSDDAFVIKQAVQTNVQPSTSQVAETVATEQHEAVSVPNVLESEAENPIESSQIEEEEAKPVQQIEGSQDDSPEESVPIELASTNIEQASTKANPPNSETIESRASDSSLDESYVPQNVLIEDRSVPSESYMERYRKKYEAYEDSSLNESSYSYHFSSRILADFTIANAAAAAAADAQVSDTEPSIQKSMFLKSNSIIGYIITGGASH